LQESFCRNTLSLRSANLLFADSRDDKMTQEAQRAAIRKMIDQHTKTVTANKEKARSSLIREGFYTADGQLTEKYGGGKKPK
jgi:hypothetical protein